MKIPELKKDEAGIVIIINEDNRVKMYPQNLTLLEVIAMLDVIKARAINKELNNKPPADCDKHCIHCGKKNDGN